MFRCICIVDFILVPIGCFVLEKSWNPIGEGRCTDRCRTKIDEVLDAEGFPKQKAAVEAAVIKMSCMDKPAVSFQADLHVCLGCS